MSANPVKVFTGSTSATIPAAVSSTPKMAHTQRATGATAASTNCSAANSSSNTPVSTPTVTTEASSNLSTTTATTTHKTPIASSTPQ